jgi:AraC-like DNA-binding protein
MNNGITFKKELPPEKLSGVIKFFWHLQNNSNKEQIEIILPDGYFDLLFARYPEGFRFYLIGLSTKPEKYIVPANAMVFAVSFKLPAVEYLFEESISPLLNDKKELSNDFWELSKPCFDSFQTFTSVLSEIIHKKMDVNIDERKEKLFNIIYSNNGSIKIGEVADLVYWSRRQINRYFQQWFGLSMKEYCQIIRYRSTFDQLKKGKLYPQVKYADQSHFIKEVRKYSLVTPKQLYRNKNDRFIQLSTL